MSAERPTVGYVMAEVVAEAERRQGDRRSLEGTLTDVEEWATNLLDNHERASIDERRLALLGIAAASLLALLRHDAAPTADLDAMPAGRLL